MQKRNACQSQPVILFSFLLLLEATACDYTSRSPSLVPTEPVNEAGGSVKKALNNNDETAENVPATERTAETQVEQASKVATEKVLGSSEHLEQPFVVIAQNLHIRSGPGAQFAKVGVTRKGTLVNVRKIEKNWAKIAHNQWVALQHIKLANP